MSSHFLQFRHIGNKSSNGPITENGHQSESDRSSAGHNVVETVLALNP